MQCAGRLRRRACIRAGCRAGEWLRREIRAGCTVGRVAAKRGNVRRGLAAAPGMPRRREAVPRPRPARRCDARHELVAARARSRNAPLGEWRWRAALDGAAPRMWLWRRERACRVVEFAAVMRCAGRLRRRACTGRRGAWAGDCAGLAVASRGGQQTRRARGCSALHGLVVALTAEPRRAERVSCTAARVTAT